MKGELIEGYSFVDASGKKHKVSAVRLEPTVQRIDMTRDEAYDVAIAFGKFTGGEFPIEIKRVGNHHYNAVVPMEAFRVLLAALIRCECHEASDVV